MKSWIFLSYLMFSFITVVSQPAADVAEVISGKWVRMARSGPVAIDFKPDGHVDVDFENDGSIDVISEFFIKDDTIIFNDREGERCSEAGAYKLEARSCYLAFDLIDDMCNGRIRMTMGFWTRPEVKALLEGLSEKLADTGNPDLNLTRARVFLAMGNAAEARMDLDEYIRHDSYNARAYINRAGTRFPADVEGVVSDCNHALRLEPENKNAYFLRGLALYEMGKKEEACADFSKAIELGFSILRIAEQQRCKEFWEEKE